MSEEWKSIFDYPDYEISSMGNVRDYEQNILQTMEEDGYTIVPLEGGLERVDQLVAKAFLPALSEHISVFLDNIHRQYGTSSATIFVGKVNRHCTTCGRNPTIDELKSIEHQIIRTRRNVHD